MSSFWNFVFGAILIIIWIVAGGFVTQANIFLGPFKTQDNDLQTAYTYTFWAAFVTWTLIGIFILLVILSIIGVVALFGSGAGEAEAAEGAEASEAKSAESSNQQLLNEGIPWLTLAFLVFALILISITGVLAAIAATSMTKSPNFNRTIANLNTAYNDCIIAAVSCLGAASLLIIGILTYFIVGIERQRRLEAQIKLEKTEEVEIREIKLRNLIKEQEEAK